MNNLVGIKVPKQKNINFPKGIFYKPEKKISFTKDLSYKNTNNIKQKDAVEIEYDLLVAAINNSDADIIGHPFGMSIKRFKIYPKWKLFKEIIQKCQKREKIFEVNFHYHKNYRQILNECLNSKTLFSLGSNAHNKNELGKITKV